MNWTVPKIWEGGTCFIIGGGPSMVKQFDIPDEIIKKVRSEEEEPSVYSPYLSLLHDKHIIGINMAYKLGNWIDIIFFGDKKFFMQNRGDLAKFPGLKVSSHIKLADNGMPLDKIKYLALDGKKSRGIANDPRKVCWNQNSGAAAISLAVHLGVKRIVLLGFDMKLDDKNKQHWHGLYGTAKTTLKEKNLPFKRHLKGFINIAKDAKRLGVEILNASPNSDITVFKKVNIKDILKEPVKINKPKVDPSVTVMCVLKSGGDFVIKDVQRLKWLVDKYTTLDYDFVCLTDIDIPTSICKSIKLTGGFKGWWSKVELFRKDLVKTDRIVFFDLDKLIFNNIDEVLTMPENIFTGLRAFNPHNSELKDYYASAIMNFKNDGSLSFIYDEFDYNNDIRKYRGDQDYLSFKLKEKKIKGNYIQDLTDGIYSYKRNCIGKPKPNNIKILCFHGEPKLSTAKEDWITKVLSEVPKNDKAKIFIQFPTKQRTLKFMKYLDAYYNLLNDKDNVQVHVSCDTNDLNMNNVPTIETVEWHGNSTIDFYDNKTKIEAINKGIPEHGWDILLLASDDMLPQVQGYDDIIRDTYKKHFPDFDGVLHFNDGKHGEKLNTLCIIGKKYYDRFGYIYHPSYKSLYCDNEFTDVSKKLNKVVYSDQIIIKHEHPGINPIIERDDLYVKNHTYLSVDKENYNKRKDSDFEE